MSNKARGMRRKINRETVPVKLVPIFRPLYDQFEALAKQFQRQGPGPVSATEVIHEAMQSYLASVQAAAQRESKKSNLIVDPRDVLSKLKKEEIDRASNN